MLQPDEKSLIAPVRNCGIICLLLLGALFTSCTNRQTSQPNRSQSSVGQKAPPAERKQTLAPGSLPDSRLTPGATLEVTKEDVCTPGYTKKVRDVPIPVKRQVYSEYHTAYVHGAYEVDHLIPLELGGSNSVRNLWPQAYDLYWGAHVKDQLENRLHEMVCQGAVPLETAQNWISQDWVSAYQRVYRTSVPLLRENREGVHKARRTRRTHDDQP